MTSNATLRIALDDLAGANTAGITLQNPASGVHPLEPDHRGRGRAVIFAAAACVAVLVGIWIVRPGESDVIESVDAPVARSISLFEDPGTPLADLPQPLADSFASARARPLDRLDPEWTPMFDSVTVVSADSAPTVTFAVGLDTTGQLLCIAEYDQVSASTSSSCNPVMGVALQGAHWLSVDRVEASAAVVVVTDDVAAVRLGDERLETQAPGAQQNIVVFDRAIDGPLTLEWVDGSVTTVAMLPDPDVEGVLELDGNEEISISAVGCATTFDGFNAEIAFVTDGSIGSALITEDGFYLTGSVTSEAIEILDPAAVVDVTVNDRFLEFSVEFDDGTNAGTLTGSCGDHHIDTTTSVGSAS